MTRIDTIAVKIFYVSLSLILTLLLIEVVANIYLWNIAPVEIFNTYASVDQVKQRYGEDFFNSSQTLYTPHHYLGYMTTPNYITEKNIHNSLGFRGEEFSVEKASNTYRIVTIGGSTTYGTGVEDYRQSYPALLEDYLQAQGYNTVEVINAGVGGYTSYESLMNIQFRVLPLQPDLLIIYQGLNDSHSRLVYPVEAYKSDNSGYLTVNQQSVELPSIVEYSTALRILGINLGWFDSQSSIEFTITTRASTSQVTTYRKIIRADRSDSFQLGPYTMMEILDENPPIYFEANTRSMILIAKGADIDVLLITPATSDKFEKTYSADKIYQRAYQEHAEIMENLAEEFDVSYLNLMTIFPNQVEYYTDGRHMTAEGNVVRAKLIGDYITEQIQIPSP